MLRHRAVIQYYEFMVTDGKSMFGFLIKVGNISSLNDVLTVFEICKETLRNKAFPIQATCQLKKHEKADVLLLCVEPCETAENLLKMNEDLSHNLSAVLPGIARRILQHDGLVLRPHRSEHQRAKRRKVAGTVCAV